MARFPLLTTALAAALAFGAIAPAFAQDAPPPPRPPKAAELKLDFGMGRKVNISCGDLSLADCITTSQALIDKVASTPVMPPHKDDRPKGGPKDGPKGEHKHDDKPEPEAPKP